ncbi:MAG: hypothetical protein Q9170_004508 [Blastenia crenularia]
MAGEIKFQDYTVHEKTLVFVLCVETTTVLNQYWIKSAIDHATEHDDVFSFAFLSGIIIYGKDIVVKNYLTGDTGPFLSSLGTAWIVPLDPNEVDIKLPPGPYVLQKDRLWKVARLYDDTAEAFTVGLHTLSHGIILPLQLQGMGQKPAIAVPSRLANRAENPLPLAGFRITVKEIFSVQGLKTGLGSRAYAELYPTASKTAPAIHKLIEAGADLIGISKMCSMVLKAPPTQCIDHPPVLLSSPEHFTPGKTGREEIFRELIKDLGQFLGAQTEINSVIDLWEKAPPSEARGVPLTEYLNGKVATCGYIYTFWQKISAFYNEYISKFGKTPFMPPPKGIHLWYGQIPTVVETLPSAFSRDRARNVSLAQHEKALARLGVYKDWLLTTYLRRERRNAILVLPLEEIVPLHRDEWPG